MKWVIIAGVVVVALVVLVVLIGSLLPRDHVAAMSAHIAADRDRVWRVITDPGAFPIWRDDIRKIELLPPGPHGPSWREHSKNGAITMVVDSARAPELLVTRIADEDLPFGGTWEYRLEDDTRRGGTKITITERGTVRNPVFRFVSRVIMGHTATIESYLRALGKRFGEAAEPVRVALSGER